MDEKINQCPNFIAEEHVMTVVIATFTAEFESIAHQH